MSPDAMTVRLHLRRIRVVAVLVDLIEGLVVEVADLRRWSAARIVGSRPPGSMTSVARWSVTCPPVAGLNLV